ncbi:DnaB-like helicase C-terminal domain-containing protein [Methylocystis echinoides]|uniref:SF4 helicase domain-containing protein n=1 Tax=Methylocystis echinoides TaxID=29468 RepID=A0A9W6GT47_9HYPH|nr:DnaB-like helicase C-terminal domain-containing protein [Methylocystis echinoides]GLI92370.1 hypothetical protein LMG27198_13620 [Methylocystis echinoides]
MRTAADILAEYGIRGILPQEPDIVPVSTGWSQLDKILKVYHPAFMVVTGRAGHGKTVWTQQLVAQLAMRQGWVTAITLFEMRIKPFVAEGLAAACIGKAKEDWLPSEHEEGTPNPTRAPRWLAEMREVSK